VLTPFMGVGSEVVGALRCGRLGIGCELKTSYYNQAVRHCAKAVEEVPIESSLMLWDLPGSTSQQEDDQCDATTVEEQLFGA